MFAKKFGQLEENIFMFHTAWNTLVFITLFVSHALDWFGRQEAGCEDDMFQ